MQVSLTEIYASLRDRFAGICDRVFIDNAPNAVAEPMSSYLIIDVDSVTRNAGTWRLSQLRIWVCVRKRESGVQDLPTINEKTNAVLSRIPTSNDLYSVTSPQLEIGMQEGEFSYSLIECDLIIK